MDRASLRETASRCAQSGAQTLVFEGDIGDLDFAENSVAQMRAQWGRIDVLVNNAAWRELVTMRQISLPSWEQTLRICLTAPAFLARWCAATMEERAAGVIINISSINAIQASGLSPAYAAAKGGLDALTYELAALYGARGIRVVGVNFGAVDTEMSADYQTSEGDDLADLMRREAENMIPLRRFASAHEAAATIAMLASPEASYLHGTNIVADGGWVHNHLSHDLKQRQMPEEFR